MQGKKNKQQETKASTEQGEMRLRLPVCNWECLTMHEGNTAAVCPPKPAAPIRLSQGAVPQLLHQTPVGHLDWDKPRLRMTQSRAAG